MNTIIKGIALSFAFLFSFAVISMILAFPMMWLWNWIMPIIIPGIAQLTVIQAWGLMVLCGFLFKSTNTSRSL